MTTTLILGVCVVITVVNVAVVVARRRQVRETQGRSTTTETGAFIMVPSERTDLGSASMFVPIVQTAEPLIGQALEALWVLRRHKMGEQLTLAEFKASRADWELSRIEAIPAFPIVGFDDNPYGARCGAYILREGVVMNPWPHIDPSIQIISHRVGTSIEGTVTSFGTYDGEFTPFEWETVSPLVAYWRNLRNEGTA